MDRVQRLLTLLCGVALHVCGEAAVINCSFQLGNESVVDR